MTRTDMSTNSLPSANDAIQAEHVNTEVISDSTKIPVEKEVSLGKLSEMKKEGQFNLLYFLKKAEEENIKNPHILFSGDEKNPEISICWNGQIERYSLDKSYFKRCEGGILSFSAQPTFYGSSEKSIPLEIITEYVDEKIGNYAVLMWFYSLDNILIHCPNP